jgi:hypothetical protein
MQVEVVLPALTEASGDRDVSHPDPVPGGAVIRLRQVSRCVPLLEEKARSSADHAALRASWHPARCLGRCYPSRVVFRSGIITIVVLVGLLAACGGKTNHDDGPSAEGGSGGASCTDAPAPPSVDFEQTCDAFVPSLGPSQVTFVEQASVGGAVAHRFRETLDCGFDVVISLPGAQFAADAQPYELSTWWIMGSVPTGLLVVVLRRPDDRSVLLGVATAGSVSQLNGLVDPLAVTLRGPLCDESAPYGPVRQVLEQDGVPLPCEDDSVSPGLLRCTDGTAAYRLIDYPGQPGSEVGPAVFGAADLLGPAP